MKIKIHSFKAFKEKPSFVDSKFFMLSLPINVHYVDREDHVWGLKRMEKRWIVMKSSEWWKSWKIKKNKNLNSEFRIR